jgi:hypothetical protein
MKTETEMIPCGVVASFRQFHGEPKQCKVFVRTEIDGKHMQTVSELALYLLEIRILPIVSA